MWDKVVDWAAMWFQNNTFDLLSQDLFKWEFQTVLVSYPSSRKLLLDLDQLIGTICMDRCTDKHPGYSVRQSQGLSQTGPAAHGWDISKQSVEFFPADKEMFIYDSCLYAVNWLFFYIV